MHRLEGMQSSLLAEREQLLREVGKIVLVAAFIINLELSQDGAWPAVPL